MHIILSHGRGSSANAKKIVYLARTAEALGHTTHRVNDIDTQDPDERLERLIATIKDISEPLVLVGSSMGGYTSVLAAEHCRDLRGLFLIAPALYVPQYQQHTYPTNLPPTEIVHGWDDDVILYEHSVRYARDADATLHLIAGDHVLHQATAQITNLFEAFLRKLAD